MHATPGTSVTAVLQLGSAPYTGYYSVTAAATPTLQRVERTFVASTDDSRAQLIFQVGGAAQEQTVCLDNVSLRGGNPPEPYEPDTGPGSASTRSATCRTGRRTQRWSPTPPRRCPGS